MGLLRRISDQFWSYVSPRKTQQRRDRAMKVATKTPSRPKRPHVKLRSMSPRSRVRNWQPTSPTMSVRTPRDMFLSPGSTLVSPGVELEGDTLVEGLDDDFKVDDANEDTIVLPDDQYAFEGPQVFDVEANRLKEEEQAEEMRTNGWSDDGIYLFLKLARRGFEPLMPQSWSLDFLSFPVGLFTLDESKAFIKPVHDNEFRAIKALRTLIDLGPRVRDTRISPTSQRGPEQVVHRGVLNYIKWAYADGKVDRPGTNIPILDIVSGSAHIPATQLQDQMLAKLGILGSRWRNALQIHSSIERDVTPDDDQSLAYDPPSSEYSEELPTLYGIIASATIVAFVAYDINAPIPTLRTVAMFDFGDSHYDVWNTLAIAILVVHCRNRMVDMKAAAMEQLMNGTEDEDDGSENDDPDA